MKKIKTFINPLSKFQENTILTTGIIGLVITSLVGYVFNVKFDGAFDAHTTSSTTFINSFLENLIQVLCVFVLLFALGKIINKKTRGIDILNTSLLYRIPFIFIGILTGLPVYKKVEMLIKDNNLTLESMDYIQLITSSIFILLLLIYSIVLLVNGFKTATNAKKWQHYVALTLVLIAIEIISKYITFYL